MHKELQFDRTTLVSLVLDQLSAVVAELDHPLPAPVDANTHLIGEEAVLDSVTLVALIVDLEERVTETYGIPVTLADDRAMSQRHSPFRTPRSLADYIHMLLAEETERDRA